MYVKKAKLVILFSAILLIFVSATYVGTIHFASADDAETKTLPTYPDDIMEQVRKSLGGNKHDPSYDQEIMALPKAKVMDLYFDARGRTKGLGPELRETVLMIFGVNLDAISAMENSGVSIFSKGMWITQQPHDLFELRSGPDDVDVKISVTDFFREVTEEDFPADLGKTLEEMDFEYLDDEDAWYFVNPSEEPIADEDKHPIMGAILNTIKEDYSQYLNNN
ncbi:hypothetical protein CR205_04590 [Alteribacter lacisalsi]|jgi:hypothetical protein|uniref:Uncharacterized protein n=1 Tax=Alteribacter lacisalsi TaxID=2045244 RepID=A0A2W0HAP3_9BACI|nr:hypothetical protein [Alteribacter lacisalsi]PYZ97876.1 hypothetical protein CR205_04590 [Alteribacter lacisalsi]